MSEERSVQNVLLEAAEYLSKLGHNLKSRSDNLKEKRITNRLKNTQSVQKVADKILLICELSKRSIENVEAGVKSVLDVCKGNSAGAGEAQADYSSEDTARPRPAKRFKYHSVGSRFVKVPWEVPLKHYLSCKVTARNMSLSKLKSYPVFYNCRAISDNVDNSSLDGESISKSYNQNRSLLGHISEVTSHNEFSDSSDVVLKRNSKGKRNGGILSDSDIDDPESSSKPRLKERSHTKYKSLGDLSEGGKLLNSTRVEESSKAIILKLKRDQRRSWHCENREFSDDMDVISNDKPHQFQSIKMNSKSLENVATSPPTEGLNRDNVATPSSEDAHCEDITTHSPLASTCREISPPSDNQDCEINNTSPSDLHVECLPTMHEIKTASAPLATSEQVNVENVTSPIEEKTSRTNDTDINKHNVNDNNSLEHKSLASVNENTVNPTDCETISSEKYIETDDCEKKAYGESLATEHSDVVADNNLAISGTNVETREPAQFQSKPTSHERSMSKSPCQDLALLNNVDTESENSPKRNSKETSKSPGIDLNQDNSTEGPVKCTTPTNTSVDNESVSEGTADSFMESSLNKLASGDEVSKEPHKNPFTLKLVDLKKLLKPDASLTTSDAEEETVFKKNKKDKKFRSYKDISKNRDGWRKENKTKKRKHRIFEDSDDNETDIRKEMKQAVSEFKAKVFHIAVPRLPKFDNKFLNKHSLKFISLMGNTIAQLTAEVVPETNVLKSALLNDSSDNSHSQTPEAKKKGPGESNQDKTPQSKRKHIMESMHAKRMLLTYSSSSDTDDEMLRNALNEIKESLLKGVSSSDEKQEEKSEDVLKAAFKEPHKRKLLASSSSSISDEDVIKNALNRSEEAVELPKEGSVDPAEDVANCKEREQEGGSKSSSISQVDGTVDDSSSSCESRVSQVSTVTSFPMKMGRKTRSGATSSGQNSESQDTASKKTRSSIDSVDGLTNLKSLEKSRRRRDSTATDDSSVSKRSKDSIQKVPALPVESLLEAESRSSQEQSDGDSGATEELPALSGLNGDGGAIGSLARDDLLDESESSTQSQDRDRGDDSSTKGAAKGKSRSRILGSDKEDDSEDDDDKLNTRRHKSHLLGSESDSGNTIKKGDRGSEPDKSEESDSSTEVFKKGKRKLKKVSDSEDSASRSSTDSQSKKKRKRIKQADNSDGSDGSDSENEGRKTGRKNIRKMMSKNQLEEATKRAAREERERVARIADRQKLYNSSAFDESGKPDEVVLDRVVLDFDPETKEPLLQVDEGLVKKLKPHQANGIKFMWDACFESVKRIKKEKGSGCILAHCMGLGKTLQVVSLTHTLLVQRKLTGVRRVLVVCPLSTVLNWVNEYRMWTKHAQSEREIDIYELSRYKQNNERSYQLQEWLEGGGVCVLGYEMFRNLSADNPKKFRKKMLKVFQESLVDPGPDLVVCDEGHLLKNEKTSLSQSMNRIKSLRRIVLTGTPLQNNLKEYYCMVQFVKPNLLGKYNEYLNRFVNPITNGQYTDSTEHDIRIMKRRSHVLHKMLDGAVQRRDYGVLAPFLPPKLEFVLFITLTEVQIKLYQYYLDNFSRRPKPDRKTSGFLFPDFQSLQRIWTHPLVLKANSERYEIMQQKKRDREEEEDSEGSLVDFIDDESSPSDTSSDESSGGKSELSDDSTKKDKKKVKRSKQRDARAARRSTRANPTETPEEMAAKVAEAEALRAENPTEWWIKLVSDAELEDMRNSNKLMLLFDILRQCETIGDKLLVFSQSLYSLDLIEHYLGKIDEATQEGRIDETLGGNVGSWSPGVDYFRLDGSTSCENRSIWCKNFNREDNPRARLFLISTRAGGLGINLVAANRVVIFDVSWNPSHDVQSIFRVYRFGQKKPCYVYRFLAMGTMEEKIYERQVTKQAISKRVIDEQQIDRHYAENDLAELYTFQPQPPEPRPLPPLPKDRLFAEMLKEHDKLIYKYHEHDSLLENKEEETLTEEERKAAWEDFENEKNRPPPVPFNNTWPPVNGMGPVVHQQLAAVALANMLRKDYPQLTEQQLANMLPIIYNSNPGLMQKMNDMMTGYKYPTAGMMNPGLMMNPGAGVEAGVVGGSSGMQYEPPWQRQQTAQNQLRLQQLMQQQNQMNSGNVKYYAGGLGSRDPVSIALQQQRQREMMMPDQLPTRGRPRTRPAAPLLPPTPSADVVDLDDSE